MKDYYNIDKMSDVGNIDNNRYYSFVSIGDIKI